MKIAASLLSALILTTAATADAAPADRVSATGARPGWYLATTADATTFGDDATIAPGLEVVGTAGDLGVGLAFRGFADRWGSIDATTMRAIGGYAGLVVRYGVPTGAARVVVHPVVQATLGLGRACDTAALTGDRDYEACQADGQWFGVAEPVAGLEIELGPVARIAVTGGYRFARVERGGALARGDLDGFVARVALELGRF